MGILGGGLLLLACPKANIPTLLWNTSNSVPFGLYWTTSRQPVLGGLAVIRLPEPYRSLADVRGYLGARALLVKPIVASAGDIVCRHGAIVILRERAMAYARRADRMGRQLPHWTGCIRIHPDQIFVLSADPNGFDSRYFGPVERQDVLGTALPVWRHASD